MGGTWQGGRGVRVALGREGMAGGRHLAGRLRRAAGLLASGDLSVAEAAFAAGFANLSHFHRQFKSAYGLTPAAFRRKIRDDGGLGGPAPEIALH